MAIAFKDLYAGADGRTQLADRLLTPYDLPRERELGETPGTLAQQFDLPLAAVYEALAYAFDHADEMDRLREADRAADRKVLLSAPERVRDGLPLP